MNAWTDAIVVLVALTNLALLGSSRLSVCIRVVAIQGIFFGLAAVLLRAEPLTMDLGLVALASVVMKGIVFPALLLRTARNVNIRREVEPFVGFTTSLFIGLGLLGIALWIGSQLPSAANPTSSLVIPLALFTVMVGLFTIASRKKAISQVLGYLTMENGIFAFGVTVVGGIPVLVELGVLMDVFVAVFVMCIATWHISREFDHIDVDQLNALKG
jgi:hydrogenase-4 component E